MAIPSWLQPTPARCWAGVIALLLASGGQALAQPAAAARPGFEAVTAQATTHADTQAMDAAALSSTTAHCAGKHGSRGYSVQRLQVPGTAFDAYPTAINNRGWVVGYSAGTAGVVPTLWIGGRVFDLGGLGNISYAYDINDAGRIVGFSFDPNGIMRATTWYRGQLSVLPSLGNAARQSVARGINRSGAIAGESATSNGTAVRAVIWNKGVPRPLESLGGSLASAFRINDRGFSVGIANLADATVHAALWKPDGDIVDLSEHLGDQSVALDINNSGRIVGYSFTLETSKPLKWQRGVRTVLPTLGGESGVAFGINERDEVVGYSQTATGLERATIWFGAKPVQLDTLLDHDSKGIVINAAYAINDRGQIAAIRRLPNNRVEPLLLTPHRCQGK